MNRLLALVLAAALGAAVAAVGGCADEMDCGLNGICNTTMLSCECRSPWSGSQCSVLLLAPVAAAGGGDAYREQDPVTGEFTTSSWGGSVIKDEADGSYVMFFSRMANHCGLDSWMMNSEIWSARSDNGALGPYDWRTAKRILPTFSHGPRIAQAPDGSYLLYHIGCGKPRGAEIQCANGTTPKLLRDDDDSDGVARASSSSCSAPGWIGLMTSGSLDGPWTRFGSGPIITGDKKGTWDAGISNPSPLILKNGSVLLMWRSTVKPESLGIATADSWKGPYSRRVSEQPLVTDPNEDPFIWEDQFGNFHGLTHHEVDAKGAKGGGKHVWSKDGLNWRVSDDLAYTTLIEIDDGSKLQVYRRERPVLLFDGDAEIALITGLQPASSQDYSYTHVQSVL